MASAISKLAPKLRGNHTKVLLGGFVELRVSF